MLIIHRAVPCSDTKWLIQIIKHDAATFIARVHLLMAKIVTVCADVQYCFLNILFGTQCQG